MFTAAFITSYPLQWLGTTLRSAPRQTCSAQRHVQLTPFRMLQRPDRDGPPDLDAFFDSKQKTVGTIGEPITLATGRALLANNGNGSAQTAVAAYNTARESLQEDPQLLHCTFSLDIDAKAAVEGLRKVTDVPLLGRSVNKKDATGTVEILLLKTGVETGISFGSSTIVPGAEKRNAAAKTAATEAARAALKTLSSSEACTFMVFSHTPGDKESVRAGLDEALPGVIAYGGPAVGGIESGDGWALMGGDSVQEGDVSDSRTVHVAAVPGSLSFLYSAVIKTWAQPAYTEPLSYMKPSYVGDAQLDLLTAVRYNDMEKFLWCIEDQGVDVNTTWEKKQNQSPLLAACARARTEMIKYLLDHGADVTHRNDGGFTASMYTRMLSEYDRPLILNQLKMLEGAGANTTLSDEEREMLMKAASGRIVE